MLSTGELILVFLIAFMVFGPEKLPELAKTLGKMVSEIRKGMRNSTAEFENELKQVEKKQPTDNAEHPNKDQTSV